MDGVLLVDKPAGITSAGVVRALKDRVGGRKIGHLGTLDPFATGLLPLCIGEGTKVAQFLAGEDKVYSGCIRLGVETDSLDCTGRVLRECEPPEVDQAMLDRVGARFAGQTWQVPPMYSAIKRGGVPLYRLARQGIEVEREPRPIEVRALTLSPAGPATVAFRVECSKGTYVRVLAADIGQALGCGAHLLSLRRERFGKFDIGSAHTLATLEELRGADLPVVPIRAALGCLREFVISAAAAAALRRGQQMVLSQLPPATVAAEHAKIVSGDGDLIAIATADERLGGWRLVRTLAPSAGEDPPPGGAKLYKRQPVC